jgi:ABC-type nickel/cobalt efflux system permease component RcnA
MNEGHDRNYISVGQWMLWMLLAAIPCVGLVVVLVMAFVGENESRKNYFRALILWFVILVGIFVLIAVVGGGWATIQQEMQRRLNKG